MNSLSIAMIAHNEENSIARALESVSWAEQIILVDCTSTDRTREIAENHGAEIFTEPNRQNLNVNKNIAIDKCSGSWILVLDADEIIPYDLAGEIRKAMQSGSCDGYLIPRRNIVLGRWLEHGGNYPDYQLRLFKRGAGSFAAQHVHERLKIDGMIGRLEEAFDHYPYETVHQMMQKGAFYVNFEAEYIISQEKDISASRLVGNALFKPYLRFVRRYIFKAGFLDGVPGLAVAVLDFYNNTMRWVKVWDLQRIVNSQSDS